MSMFQDVLQFIRYNSSFENYDDFISVSFSNAKFNSSDIRIIFNFLQNNIRKIRIYVLDNFILFLHLKRQQCWRLYFIQFI